MKKIFTSSFITILILSFIIMPCRADDSIRQKYVNYKGVKIYTEVYNYHSNANEAIIFLHGLGGNHSHGQFLYNQSNPYMTITLDYLDHGNSGHVPCMCWNTQLDSIKAVLDSYGIKKVHLVGHSFGADTAMMFAQKYPDRVKDIVLLDRAYYNYSDLERFNVTEDTMNILEYEPESRLSYNEFLQYMDMSWNNDITKTWDINKDVLLLAGNGKNFTGDPSTGTPSLAGIISMIKEDPSEFGIDPDKAKLLPDITENNVSDLVNFLNKKSDKFDDVNRRFSVIQTNYAHGDMVRDPDAMNAMRNYVVNYLKSGGKHINKPKDGLNEKYKRSIYKYNFLH
ncbi:alpha/beta fold hydrolase [Clostridium sp. JNZ X4-2]